SLLEPQLAFNFKLQFLKINPLVVVLRDHRVSLYMSRAFYHPVVELFVDITTLVADKLLHCTILIFSRGHAEHLFAASPENDFSAALRTLTVGIKGFGEPHTALETERLVGKCSHGAYVNHIPRELIIDRFFDVGADFRPVAPVEDAVNAAVG